MTDIHVVMHGLYKPHQAGSPIAAYTDKAKAEAYALRGNMDTLKFRGRTGGEFSYWVEEITLNPVPRERKNPK